MDTSLSERLARDYEDSLRARDAARVSTIRMVRAAIQSAEKVKRAPLSEVEIVDVLAREAKVRRESLSEFERGGRTDLAEKEANALKVLAEYLPQQLSEAELRAIVEEVITELSAEQAADARSVGLVMRQVMPRVKGRAEGTAVNQLVVTTLAARSTSGQP